MAVYSTDLSRRGPGLLLRDILTGRDPQVEATAAVLAAVSADVVLLIGVDYDHGLAALSALAGRVAAAGADYPHRFALRPNTGMPTDLDLDGDGRLREPEDAQGYGWFSGEGGMAVLSRLAIDSSGARDFSALLWRDLPGALIDGAGLPAEALAVQRLSTTGHWAVPVVLPGGGASWCCWPGMQRRRSSMAPKTAMAAATTMRPGSGACFWTAHCPLRRPRRPL